MIKNFSLSRIFSTLFLVFTIFSVHPSFSVDWVKEDQPFVLEEVQKFSNWGVLKQKSNGYLYLEADRRFVTEILPLIQAEKKILPFKGIMGKNGIGPHISVMYETERLKNGIYAIEELNCPYSFEILELRTVKVSSFGKTNKLWLLAVSSNELKALREKYGLKPLLNGHDFHITIGYEESDLKTKELDFENIELMLEECIFDREAA